MNDKISVCRTAPGAPCLLKMLSEGPKMCGHDFKCGRNMEDTVLHKAQLH